MLHALLRAILPAQKSLLLTDVFVAILKPGNDAVLGRLARRDGLGYMRTSYHKGVHDSHAGY